MTLKGHNGIACSLDTLSQRLDISSKIDKVWATINSWLNSLMSTMRTDSLCVVD